MTRLLAGGAFVITLLLVALAAPRGAAQAITGALVGTITDSSGAVIPGAKVTIVNTDTQFVRSMNTTSTGDYVFTLLPPGTYTIKTEETGFKTHEDSGVKVGAGDRLRVNVSLNPGTTSETVTVSANTTPLLQTESSTVQDTVGQKTVQELPLNGRNLASAVQVTAGINQASPNSEGQGNRADDRRPGFAFAANGQSDLSNDCLVDGLDNNEREQGFCGIRPSLDSISEVRVLTNDYSAEYGRTAGAIVDVITKAGTNNFHGSAYEYLRNDITDAKNFFAPTFLGKPEYRQNVFGGSMGGPIIHNRTFFFGDLEVSRMVQANVAQAIVPTAYEEQNPGDFSDIGGPVVPSNQITTAGRNYFKMYPKPNLSVTGDPNNYVSELKETQNSISTDDRIDHQFGSHDTLFVRFGYNPVSTFIPGTFPSVTVGSLAIQYPGGGGPSKTTTTNFQGNYVHIFNPNLILELKAGFTRINTSTLPTNHGTFFANQLGLVNTYTAPDSSGLPYMWMLSGDYTSIGDGFFVPILDVNNTFQYNGAVEYTRGSHSIKAGGAIIRRQLNYLQDQWSAAGGFVFLNAVAYKNSMANMLAGIPAFSERGDDLYRQGLRSWEPSLYAEDNWRVKPWLTLNLGARWEAYTPISDSHNHFANFNVPLLKIQIAGKDTSSTGGVKSDYTDFSPRIGFNASLPHNMVIRGGFGFSYYPPIMQTQVQNANAPFDYICFPCSTSSYPNLPTPSMDYTHPSGTVSAIDPNMKNAYVRQFNLFVQKQIGNNSFTIGGVGDQGRRGLYLRNDDLPLPPGQGNPKPGYVYASQLPNVTNIQYVDNSSITNYFGLEAIFSRRFTNGLTTNVNYNWGHGLVNGIQDASTVTGVFAQVTNDPMYDYGNSPLDVRHRVAGTLLYDLPFAQGKHGFIGETASGWELAMLGYWETGLPFTVSDNAAAINLPGVTSDRPNQIGNPSLSNPSISKFFNASAFHTQTQGTPGSERNNAVYGPRSRELNASLLKSFPIRESLHLQFRAEFFNITNTPNFGQPASNIAVTKTVGTIASTAANVTPRQMQFALKLEF